MSATIPEGETTRLAALRRYEILDSQPEPAFDRLTGLATRLFGVPIALITLIDGARVWFKSRQGLAAAETPRAEAFCSFTIVSDEGFVVPDAAKDPRFAEHPLVTGPTHIRFYAGAPLKTSDGFSIGSMAVMDTRPRRFGAAERLLLRDLAALAIDEIELRSASAATAQKRTERELQSAVERFELVARATNHAVWDWDLATNGLWWNASFAILFGHRDPPGEAGIETWTGRIHPDDFARVDKHIHAVIDGGGTPWSDEYRFRRADGSFAEVSDRGYVVRDENGRPLRMIGAMTDESERKRAERAQAAIYRIAEAASTAGTLHEMLRAIHAIVGELMPAPNFYIALHDPAAQLLEFPYDVDEREPVPAPPRPLGRGLTEYVLRTGAPFLLTDRAQVEELTRRGEIRQSGPPALSWVGVPLRTQQRTVGVLVAQIYGGELRYGERDKELLQFVSTQVARAIERKQGEEARRKSEQRFQKLIENTSDGIALMDASGQGTYWSPATAQILGLRPGDSMGSLPELAHVDDAALVQSKLAEALASPGKQILAEARLRRKDGALRMIDAVLTNLLDEPAVHGIVMNFRDVTERKQMEARLMMADRMVSVGTLAVGVAHEINNPLAYVIANLDFAARSLATVVDGKPESPLARSVYEGLREAQEGAARVRQIVRDLKTFSRADEDRTAPVDLHRVLDASANMAWNELRHRARLVKDYAAGMPSLLANESRLGQVFLNLLVNAAQALPEGSPDSHEVRIRTYAAEALVTVEISDTGAGIPLENRARLFDPFFTTKPSGVGTGLGLFICRNIVTALGGEIGFKSEVGKGTTFRISLPTTPAAPEEEGKDR